MRGGTSFSLSRSSRTSFSLSRSNRTSFSLSKSSSTSFSLSKSNIRGQAEAPTCAGPRPIPRLLAEPGTHGIVADVIRNTFKFAGIAYPVVKRFMLPKRSGPPQHEVRLAGRDAFDPARYLGERNARQRQEMNMVRHHRVGSERTEMPFLSRLDYLANHGGNTSILQPTWATNGSIQHPVKVDERSAGVINISSLSRRLCFTNSFGQVISWHRSGQPPCHEQPALVRMPVGQMAAIEHGEIRKGQAEACPTYSARFEMDKLKLVLLIVRAGINFLRKTNV